MLPRLRLLRPVNALMAAVGVAIGAIVAVGLDAGIARAFSILWGGVVAFLVTGAGNALNDFFDRDTDRVNHPNRPIPAGEIAPQKAFDFGLLLFGWGALAAIALPLVAFALVLLNFSLLVAYEMRFKARGFVGNLLIAWLVGSIFLFAGLLVTRPGEVEPLQIAASLAVLAGLSNAAREVVKDIEDVAGDVGRTTLPKTKGIRFAGRVAQAFLVLAVILSAVPAVLGVLRPPYVPIVIVADGIFIYAALYSTRSPGRSERAMKAAMIVALVAFLAGGLA